MGARWLYMLPALILSVVAVVLALVGLSRDPVPQEGDVAGEGEQTSQQNTADALTYSYWVAARELNTGDTIGDEDFREVSVSVPLAGAIASDATITDRLLRRGLRQGEILANSHLESSNQLAQSVPADYRAFAVAIDNTSAVGGLLEPGDLVDVLAHFKKGEDEEPTAMVLLNEVEVLAVKGRLQDAPAEDEREQSRNRNSTVVLAIPREELPRLLLADSNGELRLVMAGQSLKKDGEQSQGSDDVEVVEQGSDKAAEVSVAKLDTLFPEKKKPVRRPAPRGHKVEVYEGSTPRSTYVH